MSKNVFFLKRSKILACVFTTLLIFLCLAIIGISYAQSVEEKEKMRIIQIINPHPEFSLKLWLDKDTGATYNPGEKITIFFQVVRDCFVTLYNYDTKGRVKIIFPNQYSPQILVKAGEVNTFEGQIDPSAQPGIEYVQGFATRKPISNISKGLMPELNKDYKTFTQQFKGIIQPLPPTDWVTSNLLSYVITPIIPPQSYGSISVNSNPKGAKVYLDNAYKGLTPLRLDNINSGQRGIKIVMSGYQEWTSYISILPSQTTKVFADLMSQQSYGSISVSCDQSGAKIFLDGTYKKATSTNPVILENVEDGYHELTVIKDSFRTWVEDIVVYFGEESSVDVTMTELF
jgi:hypothetical protein